MWLSRSVVAWLSALVWASRSAADWLSVSMWLSRSARARLICAIRMSSFDILFSLTARTRLKAGVAASNADLICASLDKSFSCVSPRHHRSKISKPDTIQRESLGFFRSLASSVLWCWRAG